MSARIFAVLTLAALAAGCASTPSDKVVLLPQADGTSSGTVVVKQGEQQAVLDTPYASARSGSKGPTTARETEESVKKQFGAALGAQAPAPKSFTVYFLLNSDEFTEESKAAVNDLLAEMAKRPSPEITAIGHTDRLGPDQVNDTLSLQRAQRVKDMLVQRGVPADRVSVAGRGERELLVQTADEVAEPRNRRVEISVR